MTFSTYEDESETVDAWHECVEPTPPTPRVPPVPPPRSPRPPVLETRTEPPEPRPLHIECEYGRSEAISTDTQSHSLPSAGSVGPEGVLHTVHATIELCRSEEGASEREADTPPPQPERPPSELYYTASSEVSLLSDAAESPASLAAASGRSECIVAGHVAAMRERFESMTRTNTPCPGTERTVSPVSDVASALLTSTDQLF